MKWNTEKKKFKRKNFWSDHMIKYNYFLLIIYLVSGMDQQYGVLAHLSTQQNKKTSPQDSQKHGSSAPDDADMKMRYRVVPLHCTESSCEAVY